MIAGILNFVYWSVNWKARNRKSKFYAGCGGRSCRRQWAWAKPEQPVFGEILRKRRG